MIHMCFFSGMNLHIVFYILLHNEHYVHSLFMEVIHVYTLPFHEFPFHTRILCVLLLYACLLLCSDMVAKPHECPVALEHKAFR